MNNFNKKHYDAISKVVRKLYLNGDIGNRDDVVGSLVRMFAKDNDSFDEDRFLHACFYDIGVFDGKQISKEK